MQTRQISGRLTFTILSISLLTVMAGAAMAPALWAVKAHFTGKPDLIIQFIVSLPALFIIVTNLCFPLLCRVAKTKSIAVAGLVLYIVSGTGAFFLEDISTILILRALLGVSVGMIMPLSTGLLSYYFPPEDQSRLMGLCAAMNQAGGVIATLIAGVLAKVGWNYAFLVYSMGLFVLILVLLFLPNERLDAPKGSGGFIHNLKRFYPSVLGMLLLMICFFIFPTNFSAVCVKTTNLDPIAVTVIMVALDVVAALVGVVFGGMMRWFRLSVKYFAPMFFSLGYLCFALSQSLPSLLAGCLFIGIATGIGVPYLNTIASIKAGQDAATTVMPLLSAALYAGQFLSPLVATPACRQILPGQSFRNILDRLCLQRSVPPRSLRHQTLPITPSKRIITEYSGLRFRHNDIHLPLIVACCVTSC